MEEKNAQIEQPWGDSRIKMNGVYIGCVTSENANVIVSMQEDLKAYRRLHQMLTDCIDGRRLTEAELPDDFMALVHQLEVCSKGVEQFELPKSDSRNSGPSR